MSTILVVDDRPTNRQFLITLLRYKGYELLEAADGNEALAVARANHPDLIISDVRMPTMDGYEFVARLRADPALERAAVIFYTATYHTDEVRERAVGFGVEHVLHKPSKPQVILDAVEAILGKENAPAPHGPRQPIEQARELALLGELELTNVRLSALVELSLDLTAEADPQRLTGRVGQAAKNIIDAEYAGVGLLDTQASRIEHFTLLGADAKTTARLGTPSVAAGVLGQMLRERQPRRALSLASDQSGLGLPHHHPLISSLLAVPIGTPNKHYGWLYLANKRGARAFSESDERLALTIAAQVAIVVENAASHRLLQQELAERKRAEIALRVAAEKLERSNRELQDFAYIASHDLQEPLRKVASFGDLLQRRYGAALGDEGCDYLERMRSAARRMNTLITDLLSLSRVATQTRPFAPVDLAVIAREVVSDLDVRIEQSGARVEIGALPVIQADPLQMRQLLQNLIGNALKFQAPGVAPVVTVSCLLGAEPNGATCTLAVADNGIGFDEQYRERIFAPFQRLHSRSEYEGTGMGLAICRRIAERHQGILTASSTVGQGATFLITLPI